MSERRILKPEDFTTIVDTSQVVVTPEEKAEIDRFIETGKLRIEDCKVFYHDPELIKFSARDTYEVNLNSGFFAIEPPIDSTDQPIYAPINLGALTYLRQLAGWKLS